MTKRFPSYTMKKKINIEMRCRFNELYTCDKIAVIHLINWIASHKKSSIDIEAILNETEDKIFKKWIEVKYGSDSDSETDSETETETETNKPIEKS